MIEFRLIRSDMRMERTQREWLVEDGEGGMNQEKPDVSLTLLRWMGEYGSQPSCLWLQWQSYEWVLFTVSLCCFVAAQCHSKQSQVHLLVNMRGTYIYLWSNAWCYRMAIRVILIWHNHTLPFFWCRLNTEHSETWPARLCSRWLQCGCWLFSFMALLSSSGRRLSGKA